MSADAVVSLEGVRVRREGRDILDGVTLEVRRGEHWALLGPNGSGKTTLLNLITGYLWPTAGTVTVLGGRYGTIDLRDIRLRIGLVSSALLERIPGGETFTDIVLSGRFASLGMYDQPGPADRDRAAGIIDFLDRGKVADRPWRVLSSGERQSALIGRALMAAPSLLILDEPYEGLDLPTREHFIDRVETLMADPAGPTVLFVTHRVEELSAGITHAALLAGGRLLHAGPAETVLTDGPFGETFGLSVELSRKDGRYGLHVRKEVR